MEVVLAELPDKSQPGKAWLLSQALILMACLNRPKNVGIAKDTVFQKKRTTPLK